jgi:hypothetical protein
MSTTSPVTPAGAISRSAACIHKRKHDENSQVDGTPVLNAKEAETH